MIIHKCNVKVLAFFQDLNNFQVLLTQILCQAQVWFPKSCSTLTIKQSYYIFVDKTLSSVNNISVLEQEWKY